MALRMVALKADSMAERWVEQLAAEKAEKMVERLVGRTVAWLDVEKADPKDEQLAEL